MDRPSCQTINFHRIVVLILDPHRCFSMWCVFDRNPQSVWRRVWFSLKLNSISNPRTEQMKETLPQKTPAATILRLRSLVCLTSFLSLNIHTFTNLFSVTDHESVLALKNCADRKFSYLQLPVSLKLLYTVLQVNVSLWSAGLLRRHVTNESALTLLVGDE